MIKKLLYCLLCGLLLIGCTKSEEKTLYEYDKNNMEYVMDLWWRYNSEQLTYSIETKPLLEKIATEITKATLYSEKIESDDFECDIYFALFADGYLKIITNYSDDVGYGSYEIEYSDRGYSIMASSAEYIVPFDAVDGTILTLRLGDGDGGYDVELEKQGNEFHEISRKSVESTYTEEITTLEPVDIYEITENVLPNIKDIFTNDPDWKYYQTFHKDISVLENENTIEVRVSDIDEPVLSIWQNALGEWNYQYRMSYTYEFEYTQNDSIRNAVMTLKRSFGTGEGLWGRVYDDSRYDSFELQANNEIFQIRVHDGKIWNDSNTEELVFTEDLASKILYYFNDFTSHALLEDNELVSEITTVIEQNCNSNEFIPFNVGDSIIERLEEIDRIEPLVYHQSGRVPSNKKLTDKYLIKVKYSYGIINENYEVLLPCISNDKLYVNDYDDRRLEIQGYNSTIDYSDTSSLNATGIGIGGGHGFYIFSYLTDVENLYVNSCTEEGCGITRVEEISGVSRSIPALLISNVQETFYEGMAGPIETYSYETIGYALIDTTGKVLTSTPFSYMESVMDDFVPVKSENGYMGMINTEGKEVIPCMYDSISQDRNGYVIVEKNSQYGVVDVNNNEIIPMQDFTYLTFIGTDDFIGKNEDGTWKIITLNN